MNMKTRKSWFHRSVILSLSFGLGVLLSDWGALASVLTLHTRHRELLSGSTNEWRALEKIQQWEGSRTAVVVCDMWDKHWCPDATSRVGELAPVMNRVIRSAREKGAFVIHCPSDTMPFYKDHPGRKLAQTSPKVETKVPLQGWCSLEGQKEPALPIDDSDGGCDGCPDCPGYKAWQRQHPAIEIMEGDAITDSVEAFYLMRQRGITNVIVMGVHENMCVLGRPFSIRQMVAQGQNVVLMRDMTDSMYHHRKRPYVSHFVGTDLVCEHIEKYWCPSITSVDFLGGAPFVFKEDRRKSIVLITGENEYSTEKTLPEFAKKELEWRGFRISHVAASTKEGDSDFGDYTAIRDADAIVVSVRRRTPSKAMMQAMREHVAAGKAVIGIRTASHAFDAKPTDSEHAAWPGFDDEILGADYQGHYGNKPPEAPHTLVSGVATNRQHAVLTGIRPSEFRVTSHLYKNRNLAPGVLPLMEGRVEGKNDVEPVAWVNEGGGRRVFYTSLGNPDDFVLPVFRRLLLNGILWSLREPIPPAEPEAAEIKGASRPNPQTQAPAATAARPSTSIPLDLQQETTSRPLSPAESLSKFHIAEDLEWEQVLAEPQVTQPVFLNFDERGRMWVVEYRQYPNPAGLKLMSHDNVWRSVYDKVPPPPPNHFKGLDRISIHEDTDGDGRFDKHTVFLDGLNIVTSVERGRGGVWVLNPPYLMFYPDANEDDVPDRDPEVRLAGFGLEDTHSVANSLRWGPDGWLYGAQGSTVTGNILVYGADGKPLNAKPIYSQGQNIWRYHPEKRIYEVFSEGGGNAFGCEIDSKGRIFSGHNGGDTRGFHYLQGAYLQKGFEKHGPLSNPSAFGYFPPMPHHNVVRFTHNFVIYEGGGLPARYGGHLFGVEPLQGRIVDSEIQTDGSSFKTRDVGRPVTSEDRWFRPVDIKVGPDGAMYVCDWYDQQVNHFRNHEGKMDAVNGRVYRLKAKGAGPIKPFDLRSQSLSEWIGLLADQNKWTRQTALRLLGDKHDRRGVEPLKKLLASATGQTALEALWGVYACGGFDEPTGLAALDHADPHVRAWAVRLLCDPKAVSPAVGGRLVRLALTESNLEVRNQLAASAKRLPEQGGAGRQTVGNAGSTSPALMDGGLGIVRSLISHDADAADNRIPLLLWWAIESKCDQNPDGVVALFEDPEVWSRPIVSRHLLERLARRFAQSGARRDLWVCARLFELSPDAASSRLLLSGLEAAYRGRPMTGLPAELVRSMARHGVTSLVLGLRLGDPESLKRVLSLVLDETVPRDRRIEMLNMLSESRFEGAQAAAIRVFRGAVGDDLMRRSALLAMQPYDDPQIGEAVVGLYPKLGKESIATAQALIASRASWALQLVQAVAGKWSGWSSGGLITPDSIPPNVVRRFKQHRLPELQTLAEKVWPNTGTPTTAEMETRINKLAGVVRSGTGDPYAGRTLFQNTCGACHKLFGFGADVGPDLTVFKRDDLETMLLSIVNPNAEIREGYESIALETKDGRSLTGFLVEQLGEVVVLRGMDGQNVTLNKADLAEMRASAISLMPDGLLDSFDAARVRDLFAYLRSTQPLVGEPPRR